MRRLAYLVSSVVLPMFLFSGCSSSGNQTGPGTGFVGSGTGSGTSGGTPAGTPGGTSGGTTSGGVGTSGGTSGGTSSGTSGGSGGSGTSGGSGNVTRAREDAASFDFGGSDPAALPAGPYQGVLNGGQSRAVVGARVYVLQVNSSAYADSSVSLLSSATGRPADSIGHYVLSGEYGGFSIAGDYTCTAGRQVYIYARGGNSGGDGSNPAIGLMALLGTCPESGNFDKAQPFVFVNEVTTVAAAYAMAGIAADATHVVSSRAASADIGDAAELADVATGNAHSTRPWKPSIESPQNKVHTLANILAACINSSSSTSTSCATLFANARSNGSSGTTPDDTATAVINIARNPHANVAALYSLQPNLSAPFLPALGSAPKDFELPLGQQDAKRTVASLSLYP